MCVLSFFPPYFSSCWKKFLSLDSLKQCQPCACVLRSPSPSAVSKVGRITQLSWNELAGLNPTLRTVTIVAVGSSKRKRPMSITLYLNLDLPHAIRSAANPTQERRAPQCRGAAASHNFPGMNWLCEIVPVPIASPFVHAVCHHCLPQFSCCHFCYKLSRNGLRRQTIVME